MYEIMLSYNHTDNLVSITKYPPKDASETENHIIFILK